MVQRIIEMHGTITMNPILFPKQGDTQITLVLGCYPWVLFDALYRWSVSNKTFCFLWARISWLSSNLLMGALFVSWSMPEFSISSAWGEERVDQVCKWWVAWQCWIGGSIYCKKPISSGRMVWCVPRWTFFLRFVDLPLCFDRFPHLS